MHNNKPQREARATLNRRGFEPCSQERARAAIEVASHDVVALYEWTEAYPSGDSVGYAVMAGRLADGSEVRSRGWSWPAGPADLVSNPKARVCWFVRPKDWVDNVRRSIGTDAQGYARALTGPELTATFGSEEVGRLWQERYAQGAYLSVE